MIAALIGAALALALMSAVSVKWELGLRRVGPALVAISALSWLVSGPIANRLVGIAAPICGVIAFLLGVGAALALLARRFYGDPEREAPDTPGAILSPADGLVIYVRQYGAGETPGGEKLGRPYVLDELAGSALVAAQATVIGIAMDYLDVHVNRAPVAGRVRLLQRHRGRFLSLKRPEAVLENERVTTVLATDAFEVAVVQIASRLVRRIASFIAQDDTVEAGQRIGVIRLGSQVDLVLPGLAHLSPSVATGDRVFAGSSIVATYGGVGSAAEPGLPAPSRAAR